MKKIKIIVNSRHELTKEQVEKIKEIAGDSCKIKQIDSLDDLEKHKCDFMFFSGIPFPIIERIENGDFPFRCFKSEMKRGKDGRVIVSGKEKSGRDKLVFEKYVEIEKSEYVKILRSEYEKLIAELELLKEENERFRDYTYFL